MMKILSIAVHPKDGACDEAKNLNQVYDNMSLIDSK